MPESRAGDSAWLSRRPPEHRHEPGRQGRWDEAIDCYEQALAARTRLARTALQSCLRASVSWRLPARLGRAMNGGSAVLTHPGFKINRTFWSGRPPAGSDDPLARRAGYGDILQFIRYAPMVKCRVGRVLVLGPPALLQLVARCHGRRHGFHGRHLYAGLPCARPAYEPARHFRHNARDSAGDRCRISWPTRCSPITGERC